MVACYDEQQEQVLSVKHYFPECDIIAYIPESELATKQSRSVLPETFSFKNAVKASAISNVMIGAIINGNLDLAGELMGRDLFHEHYREKLVPHLSTIRQICLEENAYGCFLSGAGPTVVVLTPQENSSRIMTHLQSMDTHAQVELLSIDREGVQVY